MLAGVNELSPTTSSFKIVSVLCSWKCFETQFKQVNPRIEPGALSCRQALICTVESHYDVFDRVQIFCGEKFSDTELKHESNPVLWDVDRRLRVGDKTIRLVVCLHISG